MSRHKISKVEMEQCLDRVISSQVFSGVDRLQGFLRYVVEEALEGRAGSIRGKTIAMDVYARTSSSDGDPENVVRVDARRLRRRLADYYAAEGQNDLIRIHIDSGGYAPRFEKITDCVGDEKTEVAAPRSNRAIISVVAVGVAIFLVGTFMWAEFQKPAQHDVSNLKKLERRALLDKSPTTLQAVNLAEQARAMVFPVFDVERQKLALKIFEQTIRLDPDYFAGYAGAAQSLGALALLTQDPDQKSIYLEMASDRVRMAIKLGPTEAWTQASAAWVAFAKGDNDRALELSRRAYEMEPDNWYVSDIHGVIALFTGNFVEAKTVSNPSGARANANHRSGNRNIHAVANFHLGDFKTTLTSLQEVSEVGGPISAPRIAYQVAAKHALGDFDGARASASELMKAWPAFQIDIVLMSFYENPVHANDVLKRLEASGWKARK